MHHAKKFILTSLLQTKYVDMCATTNSCSKLLPDTHATLVTTLYLISDMAKYNFVKDFQNWK